jgi:hypothetical protein
MRGALKVYRDMVELPRPAQLLFVCGKDELILWAKLAAGPKHTLSLVGEKICFRQQNMSDPLWQASRVERLLCGSPAGLVQARRFVRVCSAGTHNPIRT